MQELRLVAVSEDGSYLVLASAGRGTRFTLPVDDRLRAAIRGHFSRLGQFEIEVESPLRPKEIQARIRAGETAEEIAESAGIPVERVRWFEGPVLQEREYMAQQAQRCVVRVPGESTPGPPLGEMVEERLGHRGADLEEVTWDAWKCEDNSWQVRLSFYDGGRPHAAEWKFDPRRRVLRALDDEASRLTSLVEEAPPVLDTVTPLRRPAMKIVSDQRREPVSRPFAPAPPAATPINPEPFTPERFQREARGADFPDLEALSALLEGGEPTVLPPPPGRAPEAAPPSSVSFTPSDRQETPAPAAPVFEPEAEAPAAESPAPRPAAEADSEPAPEPSLPHEDPAAQAAARPSAPQAADDVRADEQPLGDPQAPVVRPSAESEPVAPAAETAADAPEPAAPATAPDDDETVPASRPAPPAAAERSARPVSDHPTAPTAERPAALREDPPAVVRPAAPEPRREPPVPAAQEAPPAEPPAAQQPVPEPRRESPPPKPKPAPKPAPVPAAAAPAKAEPRPRKRPARNRRASVPSWDEIMFGARRPD